MERRLSRFSLALLLAPLACGHPAGPMPPDGRQAVAVQSIPEAKTAQRRRARARLVIIVPRKRHRGRHAHLLPSYVSPSTTSLSYALDGGNAVISPVAVPPCTKLSGGTLQCSIALNLAPGSHTISIAALDGSGNTLSSIDGFTFSVTAGNANSLSVTLGGIASSILLTPPTTPNVTGSQAAGYTIYARNPVVFAIDAEDADANVMSGAGAPLPVPSTPASMVLSTPGPTSSPDAWTFTSSYLSADPLVSVSSSLNVTVTPVPSSSPAATITISVPLTLWQPWIYVANAAASSAAVSITAYDDGGQTKTPTAAAPWASTSNPSAVVYDSHDEMLYVANGNNTITEYNDEGILEATFPACGCLSAPAGIAFDSANDLLYVTNETGNSVKVFNETGSLQSIGGFFSLTAPVGIAYDNSNDTIYVSTASSGIFSFSPSTGAAKSAKNTSVSLNDASALNFDSHNNLLYLADTGDGKILAFNGQLVQQTLTGAFSGINGPRAAFYDPLDGVLYVANAGNDTITAYDEEGGTTSLRSTFTGLSSPADFALIP